MARAIGYIRVSTEGQAVDGVSLDAQRERITSWCEANGYDLAGVFVDAGVSGKRADNRPGLQAALKDVCRGTALVVFSLSRLSRSVRDTLEMGATLERAGADLVSLTERIDTTTATGKLFFTIMAAFHQHYRDTIADNTRAALQHKRSKGEVVGEVPFGYRREGDRLVAVPEAQEAVALVLQLRREGLSYRRIASELQARGVATARGGARWEATQVRRVSRLLPVGLAA